MKNWGLGVFVQVIVFFCSFSAQAVDTYALATRLAQDSGSHMDLQQVLAQNPTSPDEFLKLWKKKRPDFFEQFLMAYRSRSLQQSSPSHPRVILFNDNGDLVMSFNGHPQHKGYKEIEMMRFDYEQDRFFFQEISFDKNGPQLSEPNPRKCLECHQSPLRRDVDPRPNWEAYNAWPGFYGSIDDSTGRTKNHFIKIRGLDPVRDAIMLQDLEHEEDWYKEFLASIPSHPRYSLLVPDFVYTGYEPTLNGPFTNKMGTLNYRRIARLMTKDKELYEQVKWTVAGYAICGQKMFVPPEVLTWLMEITPRQEPRRESYGFTPSTNGYYNGSFRISNLINTMFEPFGVRTDDWSMDFKTDAQFVAFERFGFNNDGRTAFARAVRRYFIDKDPDFKNMNCDQVQAKSFEKMGNLDRLKAFYQMRQSKVPETATTPLIQRCISCHTMGGSSIPHIPFDQPAALKSRLNSKGFKRGTLFEEILFRTGPHAMETEQMPPRGIPTSEQRRELIHYLQELSKN